MGRRPLIQERKHPFYFKMTPQQDVADDLPDPDSGAIQGTPRGAEYFMEQVMEGLSDACILLNGSDRVVYVNSSAKNLLRPKGRILGRKLESVLADRRLSMLAADAYHTGKPLFSRMALPLQGEGWRDDRHFHISIVPLWMTATRRLVRIALRHDQEGRKEAREAALQNEGDTMLQLKNPLSIVQGYLENMLDGVINDPIALRQSLLTMRKHTLTIERLVESMQKQQRG